MTHATEFGLSRIGQIAITVKDVKRATVFYRDTLGMKFLFEAPPGLAFFDCGGVRLMLTLAPTPELDHPPSILYYQVDDIVKAHELLASRGAVFVEKPHVVARLPDHDLWLASFRDSEGNLLALMSEVFKSG
jgi:predicted enzyme related to lactoylglutathione lyase